MPSNHFVKVFFLLAILLGSRSLCMAQDAIERLWYNEEKTAKIKIFKASDGKLYGNIVWLKEPLKDGKPKTDAKNPERARRNYPIMGLQILKGFIKDKDDENHYEDGTIYDPKNGKTYSCKITHKGDILDVRGYVGISLFGRTTTWTKADD